jgi:hypothetical protein
MSEIQIVLGLLVILLIVFVYMSIGINKESFLNPTRRNKSLAFSFLNDPGTKIGEYQYTTEKAIDNEFQNRMNPDKKIMTFEEANEKCKLVPECIGLLSSTYDKEMANVGMLPGYSFLQYEDLEKLKFTKDRTKLCTIQMDSLSMKNKNRSDVGNKIKEFTVKNNFLFQPKYCVKTNLQIREEYKNVLFNNTIHDNQNISIEDAQKIANSVADCTGFMFEMNENNLKNKAKQIVFFKHSYLKTEASETSNPLLNRMFYIKEQFCILPIFNLKENGFQKIQFNRHVVEGGDPARTTFPYKAFDQTIRMDPNSTEAKYGVTYSDNITNVFDQSWKYAKKCEDNRIPYKCNLSKNQIKEFVDLDNTNPKCRIKIKGQCGKYPEMSESTWFDDNRKGGPKPTTKDACENRRISWQRSCTNNYTCCDNTEILMDYQEPLEMDMINHVYADAGGYLWQRETNRKNNSFFDYYMQLPPSQYDGDDSDMKSKKQYNCKDIGSWPVAQDLLQNGHTYLDKNNSGIACEELKLKCNNIESWEKAQQLLFAGHSYLDERGNGEACPNLRE